MELIKSIFGPLTAIALFMAVFALTIGAWIQHFITSVSQEMWVLLVMGAIIPPLGMLHGWLVWLGVL